MRRLYTRLGPQTRAELPDGSFMVLLGRLIPCSIALRSEAIQLTQTTQIS